jgi:hypothetical protein
MSANLSTYDEHELRQTLASNPWDVRDETLSHHNILARQVAAAKRRIERLMVEMNRLAGLHHDALAAIRLEQGE